MHLLRAHLQYLVMEEKRFVYKGFAMVNYRADGFSNNWVSKGVNERKDVPQAVEDDRSQEVVGRSENESHEATQDREWEDPVHAEVQESKDDSAKDHC